ncbi:sulfatase-like hydrolase/transferase [Shewanella eurypsychrophilus]|uniref:Sulfatase-like hydrolase/transferase n=1 Tax=Shewanella eurypsychrophilus TaxID=2593656 RepID=A0ABX6V6X9_9GAMM|nr:MULTISPECIES: sulfatase-like hydrolase/transferase [Shewanella]QFU22963.1 sulfatase-like hydrolase/transferase [Shewanella sp. YLB-09]QPG58249.1 sulfatase-like hydrolase/transferase [Shewanella eurypsychrophilus]
MESKLQVKGDNVSMLRTFWRTNAFMLLFLVALYNFKLFIQYFSSFSIASVMTHVRSEDLLSTGLLFDLSQFVFLVIFFHLLWSLVITISCKPWFSIIKHEGIKTQVWLVIVLLHFTLVLAANAYFYPTSLLGFLRNTPMATVAGLLMISVAVLLQFLWSIYSQFGKKVTLTALFSVALLISLLGYRPEPVYTADNNSPNVFIIGIDGLRPDHLNYIDSANNHSPNIDEFISHSTVYTNTYTPLGRTYVAWMSILSGLYPKNHGARFNLAPPELINKEFPLVRELNKKNYQTIYAMDERRFNQIDEAYGFDEIIGPKVGAADAIISGMADFPLINLLSNIPGSSELFPYLNMNRGYGKAYSPNQFNQKVLSKLSSDKPNFLSIHFCQLHWPYTSKDFIDINSAQWKGNYNHFMYQAMLKKVDQQFSDFISSLEQRGYLDNAIVYLISDHGEGFMLKKDEIHNPSIDVNDTLHTNAWGHGTNVMSQDQTNVLMSYRRFNKNVKGLPNIQQIQGNFSLIDIAPSLFEELNLSLSASDTPFDGLSLQQSANLEAERAIFVESSVPFRSINASFIDEKEVIYETASNYEVRDNGRAVIIPSVYKEMVAKKQRAVYFKHWQLAMLPNYEELVLIDTQKQLWYQLSQYKGSAPWRGMLFDLCRHYQHDLGFDQHQHCRQSGIIDDSTSSPSVRHLSYGRQYDIQ